MARPFKLQRSGWQKKLTLKPFSHGPTCFLCYKNWEVIFGIPYDLYAQMVLSRITFKIKALFDLRRSEAGRKLAAVNAGSVYTFVNDQLE